MTLNRKLLEKQRVQNRFAFYEVHIGHFFYNVNATISFGNRLYSDLKFFLLDRQTDRQMDKTHWLTPLHMHARGNYTCGISIIFLFAVAI